MAIEAVVFDLGGVLIDWNPRYLFSKLITDPQRLDHFLSRVCTREWNERFDEGLPFAEGVRELKRKFPEWSEEIEAYDHRWSEMITGQIDQTVDVLGRVKRLRETGHLRGLYALSNWSQEKFSVAEDRFAFLSWFDGKVVSGYEGVKKPDPKIYHILIQRHQLKAGNCLFIDDVEENLSAARKIGFETLLFTRSLDLSAEMRSFGLPL